MSDAVTDPTPTPDPAAAPAPPASPAPAISIRYEWGPDVPTAVQPPRIPGVKDDAHVVFVKFDEMEGTLHFELASHDPDHENVPVKAHAVWYAPGAAIHAHAADAIAAAAGGDHPTSSVDIAVTDRAAPTPVVLPRPSAAKANLAYTAKTVLEFHDAA